ncbi:hypothetical protein LCGC14_2997710, partial [marine sediment metagenome]
LDTGHPLKEGDEAPAVTHTFETEAEAKAFIMGVNEASEQTNGWTEGWLEAELEKE